IVRRKIRSISTSIQFHRRCELDSLLFGDRTIMRESVSLAGDGFVPGGMENENHACVVRLQCLNERAKRYISAAELVFVSDGVGFGRQNAEGHRLPSTEGQVMHRAVWRGGSIWQDLVDEVGDIHHVVSGLDDPRGITGKRTETSIEFKQVF